MVTLKRGVIAMDVMSANGELFEAPVLGALKGYVFGVRVPVSVAGWLMKWRFR